MQNEIRKTFDAESTMKKAGTNFGSCPGRLLAYASYLRNLRLANAAALIPAPSNRTVAPPSGTLSVFTGGQSGVFGVGV